MNAHPRYLFRRSLAFFVDVFLAGAVAVLLVAPFVALKGTDSLRFGAAPIKSNQCFQAEIITPERLEFLGALPVRVHYCRQRVFGFDNGGFAKIVLSETKTGNMTRTLSTEVFVSDSGDPVRPGTADVPLSVTLMVVGSAAFLARTRRRTPGKALLGLRVEGLIGRSDALRREGIRGLPLMVLTFAAGILDLAAQAGVVPALFLPGWASLAGGLLLLVFILWYYVVPFFTGDRRARWDRVVGSNVRRV